MARDKWPYIPPSICSMLPGDLPSFLQTGATHTAGRAVTIVDPAVKARAEPIDRFDGFQPFCKCLRGGCPDCTIGPQCEISCVSFTYNVAAKLLADFSQADASVGEAVRYRCYLGLEEWAVPFSVGGVNVVMISGQFAPPEGLGDIKIAVSSLGKCVPQFDALSAHMQESLKRFSPPEDVWLNARVTDADRGHLLSHLDCLLPADDEFGCELRRCAERVTEISHKYYDMKRTQVESTVVANIQLAARQAAQRLTGPQLWPCVRDVLDAVRAELGLTYVAFFSGAASSDTILRLKADSKRAGKGDENARWPHFNWRKAGLRMEDVRDTDAQTLNWDKVALPDRGRLLKGLKGGDSGMLHDASSLIPVRLPGSPLGLLILGPHERNFDLDPHNNFVVATCQDVATRILTMYMADILAADRTDWQRTANMTGHRVRASIQSIDSQMKILVTCPQFMYQPL